MTGIVVYPPMRRFKPAESRGQGGRQTIFLAGSIEMGKAVDWQAKACAALLTRMAVIYNPRRPDWDSSWTQHISNPEFNAQVNWELDMIEMADKVLFYFDPNTKSPITLMELGLCKGRGRDIYVCCPEGYWRKGNVDILCEREGFIQFSDLDWALRAINTGF